MSIYAERAAFVRAGADIADFSANAALEEIAAAAPSALKRAMLRVAGSVRSRMAKGLAENPVLQADLTRALRDGRLGGRLGKKSAIKITWLDRSSGAFGFNVDWIPALRPYVSRFVEGGSVGLANPRVRAALHRALSYRGRRDVAVDPAAVQPPREVLEPVRDWAAANYERSVRGALRRVFEDAARGKSFTHRSGTRASALARNRRYRERVRAMRSASFR